MNILDYHHRTKHQPDGYAAGPETIDWDNQPDPFRRFEGTTLVSLPLVASQLTTRWADVWQPAPASDQPAPLTLERIAQLLECSLALSAWKQYGTARWSLRVNPSSGNLHPTECYVLAANIPGLDDGVYHYRADLHGLERRCSITAFPDQRPQLLLGFSSVFWREAWKYGERAYRYCQHDVGHALAAVSYGAAVVFGEGGVPPLRPISIADADLSQLLGLDRTQDFGVAEAEHPDCLIALSETADLAAFREGLSSAQWQGQANVLDPRHFYQWPVIDEAAEAAAIAFDSAIDPETDIEAVKASSPLTSTSTSTSTPSTPDRTWPAPRAAQGALASESAVSLIRHRRSAQAFNPAGTMSQEDFATLLDHCLPRANTPPWNCIPQVDGIHLLLFVHQVESLPSGLYALLRNPADLPDLKRRMRDQFEWVKVEWSETESAKDKGALDHLPLYRLLQAGTRRTAAGLSCQQAIAGDSAFSLAMLADMRQISEQPQHYRYLHWQAGAIGQVLYLEAEAAALRGTGIGCFFDDRVHNLLGLEDDDWQVLYHFTVGEPIVDQRITTLSAYSDTGRGRSPDPTV